MAAPRENKPVFAAECSPAVDKECLFWWACPCIQIFSLSKSANLLETPILWIVLSIFMFAGIPLVGFVCVVVLMMLARDTIQKQLDIEMSDFGVNDFLCVFCCPCCYMGQLDHFCQEHTNRGKMLGQPVAAPGYGTVKQA